jgi:transposase
MVVAGVGFNPGSAWATAGQKVDCDKVMAEVHAGKKTKDIAKDLSISPSSVYKCKKKAAGTASKSTAAKATGTTSMASPAAASSPAAK